MQQRKGSQRLGLGWQEPCRVSGIYRHRGWGPGVLPHNPPCQQPCRVNKDLAGGDGERCAPQGARAQLHPELGLTAGSWLGPHTFPCASRGLGCGEQGLGVPKGPLCWGWVGRGSLCIREEVHQCPSSVMETGVMSTRLYSLKTV